MALIHGIDSNSKVIPLLLDASGNIIVSASQLTTTGGKIKVDASGRITIIADEPNALNPTPKTFLFQNLSLPAGSSTQTVLTVPNGERWRMTGITLVYTGTVAGVTLRARINNPSGAFAFYFIGPPVSAVPNTLLVNVLLEAAWIVEIVVGGATLNDDLNVGLMCERVQ